MRLPALLLAVAALSAGVALAVSLTARGTPVVAEDSPPPPVDKTVVVVDRTEGTWAGIPEAVEGWSRSPLVDLVLRRQCDPSRYCIIIRHPDDYGDGWIGWWKPLTRRVSTIRLNRGSPFADDPRAQAWTACHELGHALGLGEVYEGSSGCMVDGIDLGETTPTARDMAMLKRMHAARAAEAKSALAFVYRTQ